MKLLLKKTIVLQPESEYHHKRVDILIEDGYIQKIDANIPANDAQIISSDHLHTSSGWVDVGTHIGEPGYEHREDIKSVTNTAASGGYTTLLPFPNTLPVVDNGSQIERLIYRSAQNIVQLLPIGSVSHKNEGVDIAELYDMHHAGSIAFSDGAHAILDEGLLLRSMEYVKAFDGIIIQHASNTKFIENGQMHEGSVSTSLGLVGMPSIAEFNKVKRDLSLRQYADGRLMIHLVSTEESVKAIQSEDNKKQLYASVGYQNLIHTDADLIDFDSHLKLMPPLRSEQDQRALINAIKTGVLDIICSNHTPLEEERKKLEFPYAGFGATGLETCFAAVNGNLMEHVPLETIIDCLSYNPRAIFNIKTPLIKEGELADITVFDPKKTWTYRRSYSKSKNNPYFDQKFTGKVLGIVNNRQYFLNQENQ